MPLIVKTTNFNGWRKYSANYYYPDNNDSDNHIHVGVSINESKGEAEIKFISIKINGVSKNLRPMSAIRKFKFDPKDVPLPADPEGARYLTALRDAGLIE